MKLTHLRERFPEQPSDLRTRILIAAGGLFQQSGYAGTSMSTIASAVEITPAALYWHFTNKEEILFEFLKAAYEAFELDISEELAGHVDDDPVSRLRRVVHDHTYLRLEGIYATRMDPGLSIGQLSRSVSPEHLTDLRRLSRLQVHRVRGIIEEGIQTGVFAVPDPLTVSFAITTMCEYAPLWFSRDRPMSVEHVARTHEVYALRAVGVDSASMRISDFATADDPEP